MPADAAPETVLGVVPRRLAYSLLGAALAAGAPCGLLLVKWASGGRPSFSWMAQEIASEPISYAYVLVSILVVFAVFGWFLGMQADRLIELSRASTIATVTKPVIELFAPWPVSCATRSGQPT